ncbi:unnamed protein product [Arctia plantaginis]|uniref:Uncharacterized protein n=1 Tax=Arctia plantaginis TaxID=874455 RepID=A0A8S1AHL9_ARCPL|nr:unnamed protein product [Arctia plantaginis]CAB3260555.1 unnamed protein product [Arctia plantaginis]
MNSWLVLFIKLLVIQTVISEYEDQSENSTVNRLHEKEEVSRTLSRRKRFIIFPEGSSLQLVFCTQAMAWIPIGDIFLYGNTIALAWTLPSDPMYLNMFKTYERANRRNDVVTKTLNYVDEDGRIIAKVPYKPKLIVNPAFAKRSVDDKQMSFKEKLKTKIDRKKMHEKQINRDYLKVEYMDKDAIEFHRSNRLDLYQKLETLFTGLGGDGRQCVLYKLCEAAQRRRGQGTFLEEFLTVVFTLPKGKEFDLEEHQEYDAAHTPSDDCSTRLPKGKEFDLEEHQEYDAAHTPSDDCSTRYPGCVES